MRFIVDQSVSPILSNWLQSQGHDAFHLRDRQLSCATDEAIFDVAIRENRIIVTSDLDFSRIVALSALDKPGIILFRAGNITDQQMLKLLQNVLTQVSPAKLQASIISVEATRLRISPLPVKPT